MRTDDLTAALARGLLTGAHSATRFKHGPAPTRLATAAVQHSWPWLLAAYLTYWIGDSADGNIAREITRRAIDRASIEDVATRQIDVTAAGIDQATVSLDGTALRGYHAAVGGDHATTGVDVAVANGSRRWCRCHQTRPARCRCSVG